MEAVLGHINKEDCISGHFAWTVHFGSHVGSYIMYVLILELWGLLFIYFKAVRRRTEQHTYGQKVRSWLKRQLQAELSEDEGEELVWHGFPNFRLAAEVTNIKCTITFYALCNKYCADTFLK